MASSSILLSFIFLLFLIYYPQVQVQGRESKFFSKSTLNTNNNISSSINTTTLTNTTANNNNTVKDAKQEEVPISFTSDTHDNGYGLYGQGSSDQFPPTTTNINNPHETYTDRPNKTTAQEYTGASYDDEFKELNKAYNNNNWYGTKQQGMSDTRFIGNGRYFYDVDNMNSDSNEYPSMNVNNEGFGSSGEVTTGRYYDENASDDDFNKYIGESQLNEELQESQEEFVP